MTLAVKVALNPNTTNQPTHLSNTEMHPFLLKTYKFSSGSTFKFMFMKSDILSEGRVNPLSQIILGFDNQRKEAF